MLTRLSAVAALRGNTWAADRVFDSDNTPLAQALTLNSEAKPYIVVYTDADNRTEVQVTDLNNTRRELNLVLEIGVASKVEGDIGKDAVIKTPLTDAGMEMALDMVENQALDALFGNPQSDWAELLKGFVLNVIRISGQRGASADRDRRWAARQLSIICDVASDLPIGVPVPDGHPIRNFVIVAEAHPEAGMDHAAEICEAIVDQEAAPEWEQVQATLGARRVALRAIGLAPLSSDLPTMATMHGDDLTDGKGESPILRELTAKGYDMAEDEAAGLLDEVTIKTNVAVVRSKELKDKVEADGDAS